MSRFDVMRGGAWVAEPKVEVVRRGPASNMLRVRLAGDGEHNEIDEYNGTRLRVDGEEVVAACGAMDPSDAWAEFDLLTDLTRPGAK